MKRNFISEPESEYLEFKECSSGKLPNGIWRTICAFANSRGGRILLGVRDNGEILGLSPDVLDRLQKEINNTIDSGRAFNCLPKVKTSCDNGYVEVQISEADTYSKPIFLNKDGIQRVFVRHGSTTSKASNDQLTSMMISAQFGSSEMRPLEEATLDDIDANEVNDFIKLANLSEFDDSLDKDVLNRLRITKNGHFTAFGLLAFGKASSINTILGPKFKVDFRHYSGSDKISGEKGEIYLDRKEFTGNLRKQFEDSFAYIKTKLPRKSLLNTVTGKREEVYAIPEEALREALVNAIGHRDYGVNTSSVVVNLFSDRLEIENPGDSLVPIELFGKTDSKTRNPDIMNYLQRQKIAEQSARGIITIKNSIAKRGLLSPKFENLVNSFKVSLFFATLHNESDKVWIANNFSNYKLKESQTNALIYIKNNGSITNSKYCEINRMNKRNDERKARRELAKMIEFGLIELVGSRKNAKYVLLRGDKA